MELLLLSGPDEGCGVVFLAVLALIPIISFAIMNERERFRTIVLAKVGRRRNGRVIAGRWFSNPMLEFRIDNIPGVVTFNASPRGSKWTKVQVECPTAQRLRVTPQGFTRWLRSLISGADIEVGDRDFDRNFWVESSDPAWARRVLSERVRRRFLGLRQDSTIFATNDVTLDVGPSGVTLKVSKLLVDDSENLEWFVDMAALILDEVRALGAVAGIVIASVETRSGSLCPVCGHGVSGGRKCPQCRTPHHDDCWEYSGGCALFACAAGRRGARAA